MKETHYHSKLHNKLQRLTQGSWSVDKYYMEMEVAMVRANIVVEELEDIMALSFLLELNREIQGVVEL